MTGEWKVAGIFGLALLVGACGDSTDRVETTDYSPAAADQTTVRGSGGERLTLVRPRNVQLRRGEAESVVVQIRRRDFSDEVKISVSNLPRGVEAVDEPRSTTSDRVEFVLRASEDADLVGNHEASVTAEGPDDIRATEKMKISVRAK